MLQESVLGGNQSNNRGDRSVCWEKVQDAFVVAVPKVALGQSDRYRIDAIGRVRFLGNINNDRGYFLDLDAHQEMCTSQGKRMGTIPSATRRVVFISPTRGHFHSQVIPGFIPRHRPLGDYLRRQGLENQPQITSLLPFRSIIAVAYIPVGLGRRRATNGYSFLRVRGGVLSFPLALPSSN